MKIVILGMCDPAGREPLAIDGVPGGAAGVRLWKMSGLSREKWVNNFERDNLLPGKKWLRFRARTVGREVRRRLTGRKVVVLGRETWLSLGLPSAEPIACRGGFYFVPHPSGRNLWYNNRANRDAVGALLRELASR